MNETKWDKERVIPKPVKPERIEINIVQDVTNWTLKDLIIWAETNGYDFSKIYISYNYKDQAPLVRYHYEEPEEWYNQRLLLYEKQFSEYVRQVIK